MKLNSQSSSDRDGILVNEVTVATVTDISGTQPPFFSAPVDLGMELTLELGKSFQPQFRVAGNFQKNQAGEVVGWSSAFKVRDFFRNAGITDFLDDDNKFRNGILQQLIGYKFLRLSYSKGEKDGKLKYSDWGTTGTLADGPDALKQKFLESVDKGYPKNYIKPGGESAEQKTDTPF